MLLTPANLGLLDKLVFWWIAYKGYWGETLTIYKCAFLDLVDKPRRQKPKEDLLEYLSSLPKNQALRAITRLEITRYPDFDHELTWQLLAENPPSPADMVRLKREISTKSKMNLKLELLRQRLEIADL